MALTLVEVAKTETNLLRKGVISTLLLESDFLQLVPFETISALSTTVTRFAALPSVGFRYPNEAYNESTGTFDQLQESVYPLGGDIDVDVMYIMNKQATVPPRAIQTEMKLKAMAYTFNDVWINGDQAVDPRGIDGVKKRIGVLKAAQTISAATNGLDVIASTANMHSFIDAWDKLGYAIDGHKPDAYIVNKSTLLRLRSAFRRIGLLTMTEDQFGRNVDHYAGVPIYDAGVKSDQATQIITDAETQGTATDATSMYAVKFGVEVYTGGIQEYELRVADFGELESKAAYRTRVDWPFGIGTWHARCLARLQGLRMVT